MKIEKCIPGAWASFVFAALVEDLFLYAVSGTSEACVYMPVWFWQDGNRLLDEPHQCIQMHTSKYGGHILTGDISGLKSSGYQPSYFVML